VSEHLLARANGAPVVDNVNIETAGLRRPALLQDVWLLCWRSDITGFGTARLFSENGKPNSRGEWIDRPDLKEPPLAIDGAAVHWDRRVDEDYHQRPGDLFRQMRPDQRQALFDNAARAAGGASPDIRRRHIANCCKADPAYGEGVAAVIARLTEAALAAE